MIGLLKDLLKEARESVKSSARLEERLIIVKESISELKGDTKDKFTEIIIKLNDIQKDVSNLEAKYTTLDNRINTVFQSAVLNTLDKLDKEEIKKLVGADINKKNDELKN